jgi:hypothetical protein
MGESDTWITNSVDSILSALEYDLTGIPKDFIYSFLQILNGVFSGVTTISTR